jgi:putative transcriptional regulator
MGVAFPDSASLESAASAIGSNMFEGFEPTPKRAELYLNFREGEIKLGEVLDQLKNERLPTESGVLYSRTASLGVL